MASFLDKAGLTKFWELIKQYLQENFTPMYEKISLENRVDNIDNKRDKRRELTKKLSETIISNVKGCKNLKKITFQYKVNKPSTNKIQFLLDAIKDYILNSNDTDLKLDHKGTNDNTIDYTIEIEAI